MSTPFVTPFYRIMTVALRLAREYRENPAPHAGERLGSHSEAENRLTFYAVDTFPRNLLRLKERLDETGVPYRFVVDEPNESISNVQILDIGI